MKPANLKKAGLGFVQVYWGNGKGKTTAALGTALRACGNLYTVHLIQFMKNGADTLEKQIPGEITALDKFPNFTYKRFGIDGWVLKEPTLPQRESAKEALEYTTEALNNPKYDIIIVDEILYAIQLGLIDEQDVLALIEKKPKNKELILTGSHKPYPKIFEKADLVTEIKKHKHPYDAGFIAREGIEY